MRTRVVVLATALVALALALPAGASASPCAQTFTDSAGFNWSFNDNGAAVAGGKGASPDPFGNSAFNFMEALNVVRSGKTPTYDGDAYVTPNSSGCTLAVANREIRYPERTMSGNALGLAVSRRVYVPPSGRAFARWTETIRNVTSSPITFDFVLSSGLGSDCGTTLGDDSDGNAVLNRHDRWATTYDPPPGSESCPDIFLGTPNPDNSLGLPLAHNWDGQKPVGGDSIDDFPPYYFTSFRGGFVFAEYRDIALAPGQSASYLHFVSQPTTDAANKASAKTAAQGLDAEPPEAFAGMSAADLALVQNWCARDCDHDTKPNSADNCPAAANAGQLDTDKDTLGNTCDSDDDNDGRSDTLEAALGTSPTNPKDAPPQVTKLKAPKRAKAGKAVTLKAAASDDYGVRQVTFFAGKRRLCTDVSAPFACSWTPRSKRARKVTVSAVASDALGQAAILSKVVRVKP